MNGKKLQKVQFSSTFGSNCEKLRALLKLLDCNAKRAGNTVKQVHFMHAFQNLVQLETFSHRQTHRELSREELKKFQCTTLKQVHKIFRITYKGNFF